MNTSLEWLSDFLPDGVPSAEAAADALTMGGFPVEHVAEAQGDRVLDVEVTSNRPDCLSHAGVARELAALLNLRFEISNPNLKSQISNPESEIPGTASAALADRFRVSIDRPDLCPQYTARLIEGVTVGPSPDWLRRRIEAVGLRAINNVVDVTNYVLFDLGQPLHAFDFSTLRGGRIVVRTASVGETLTTLDGQRRAIDPGDLVIADAERPVALAGVMGGLETEVTAGTTSVLLEAAVFDPLTVRKTARRLAMQSDSSYRFERGIDPTLPMRAGARAADLIADLGGGTVVPGVAVAGEARPTGATVTLRLSRLRELLGVDLPTGEVVAGLKRLGFGVTLDGDQIAAVVPSHRLDVTQEVDLIEESVRVVGYDRVPTRDEISIRLAPPDPARAAATLVRHTLAASGCFEAITFSFVSDKLASDFLPPGAAALQRVDPSVRKADARLRPSLLPGLLESRRRNESAGTPDARLFETGSAFWLDADGAPQEHVRLAVVGGADFRELRGVVEELLARLDAARPVTVEPAEHAGYGKGACGRVAWGDAPVGFIGVVDRSVADKIGLREPVPVAELDHAALIAGAVAVPTLVALAKFPAVRRDLSLVVPEPTRFEALARLVAGLSLADLEAVEYVMTYRGKPLAAGRKSVTIALAFRSPDRTLTGEAVDAAVASVVDAARSELSAEVRT